MANPQDQKFESLKQKYQPAMTAIQQQNVSLQHVNMEGDKLYIQGVAPSEEAKNKVWDAIKAVDPNYKDLTCDITVQAGGSSSSSGGQAQGAGASVGGGQGSQMYTVKSGDSLSKIAQQFYGSAGEYMRIFNANRDKIQDPDKIRVGDQITIPSQDV